MGTPPGFSAINTGENNCYDFLFGSLYSKKGNLLTHCILVDSSIVICLTSPFVFLGVMGLFCHFYSIFD